MRCAEKGRRLVSLGAPLFLLVGSVPLAPFPAVSSGIGVSPSVFGSAQEAVLEEEALRFARAWVDGDTGSLEPMLEARGIRLHIQGDLHTSVDLRRAVVALRAFLGRYPGGEAELMRVSRNAGEEPTGFAEVEWRTTVAGTGQSVIFTVFVAYVMEGGAWMVTEIRVLS